MFIDFNPAAQSHATTTVQGYAWVKYHQDTERSYQARARYSHDSLTTNYEMFSALKTIHELVQLPPDWDGYGALPIDRTTADNAAAAIGHLLAHTAAPEITPNTNGTLSLEWEGTGGSAHLEIGMTRYSFYIKPNKSQTIYRDGLSEEINASLGNLVQALLFSQGGTSQTITNIEYTINGVPATY